MKSRKRTADKLVIVGVALGAALVYGLAGCPAPGPPGGGVGEFNNTTDPTNNNARYIGSSACVACHASICEIAERHGHSQALKIPNGVAPVYPEAGDRAGVPNPPDGFAWTDISYVISGYLHGAFFVDAGGYILTTGTSGVDTQWNLDFPPNGTDAGFVAYKPDQAELLPYDYETCFRCHTTGPMPQTADNPQSQDGRPGILGTWAEAGVRCEACHGPGSNHAPNPMARDLYVDTGSVTCQRCHLDGDDAGVINAKNGFVNPNTQYAELRASGGHATFECGFCHDPHASSTYDRARGIRNECTSCHSDMNMALHEGITYQRGDYTETLSCESCHMALTGLSANMADPALVGPAAKIGDVQSHIFRINVANATADEAFFAADGETVLTDDAGRAAVTIDFVCLRCHNGAGNGFSLTLDFASQIAENMHAEAE